MFQLIWFFFCWFLWLWLWCYYYWCGIAVPKGYSSNLKASSCEWPWLKACAHGILAFLTSTCALARNKTAPASNFPAFVSTRQSCNPILDRMFISFFFFLPVVLWKYTIRIQLPQVGENKTGQRNGKEDCRKVQLNHLGIKKRNGACHKAKFHKGHWAGLQTSPPSAQLWNNRRISGAVTRCDSPGACELIGDLRLNFNSHLL